MTAAFPRSWASITAGARGKPVIAICKPGQGDGCLLSQALADDQAMVCGLDAGPAPREGGLFLTQSVAARCHVADPAARDIPAAAGLANCRVTVRYAFARIGEWPRDHGRLRRCPGPGNMARHL